MTSSTKVANELQNLAEDLKDVLSEEALAGNAKVKALRERLEANLQDVRETAVDAAKEAAYRARRAAKAADEYAHEEPWPVVGAALATGVILGFLLGRR